MKRFDQLDLAIMSAGSLLFGIFLGTGFFLDGAGPELHYGALIAANIAFIGFSLRQHSRREKANG